MDLEEFKKTINWFINKKKRSDDLYEAFKNYDNEGINFVNFDGEWEDHFIKLLELVMNDNYQWISYWIYDLDRKDTKDKVKDKDGKSIPIKTITDLFNLITSK